MFSCGGEVRGGRVPPPSLGPPPDTLTPIQLRRRHVVAAIIHSENSYVATLQRLINVSHCHTFYVILVYKSIVLLIAKFVKIG